MSCDHRLERGVPAGTELSVGGVLVRAIESVGFDAVLGHFLAHSGRSDDSWTVANLTRADRAFAGWIHGRIAVEEAESIVLPFHVGGCERSSDLPQRIHLVPPGGLTVRDAHRRLDAIRESYRRLAPHCSERISRARDLAAGDPGPFFFSEEPVLEGSTYRGLTAFRGRMTHLDGLHRLLGLMETTSRPASIDAFVAVTSDPNGG